LSEIGLQIAGFIASFRVISLLFAVQMLRDTQILWRDVWIGAIDAPLLEIARSPWRDADA